MTKHYDNLPDPEKAITAQRFRDFVSAHTGLEITHHAVESVVVSKWPVTDGYAVSPFIPVDHVRFALTTGDPEVIGSSSLTLYTNKDHEVMTVHGSGEILHLQLDVGTDDFFMSEESERPIPSHIINRTLDALELMQQTGLMVPPPEQQQ